MKKKDHLPYTNIVGKKRKKKSNGIDSVQPQKIMSIYFDRLYSHFGIGLLMYGRLHKRYIIYWIDLDLNTVIMNTRQLVR
jgi:hypothetical protein